MKKVKIIEVKPMKINWVNERHDTDGDMIPNYFDCNPWNPNEQGWLHDTIDKLKDRHSEVKQMKKERKGKEAYFSAAKQDAQQHAQVEAEIQKQVDRAKKPVYLYAKMGDPRLKGGLKWYFIGGYERGNINQVVRELSSRQNVHGVESSDRADMEGYLNRRDFGEAVKKYGSERWTGKDKEGKKVYSGWKENVERGLMSKDKQERLKRLKSYQKRLAIERAITGAPQVIVHTGDEFNSIVSNRRPKKRMIYQTYPPRMRGEENIGGE